MDCGDHDSGHPAIVTFHWRDHGRYLVTGLLDMFRRSSHVDTDINFDFTDDGSSPTSQQGWPPGLKVHRLVLSVFLSSTLIEDTKLDLNHVAEEADDVRALIEFIYTGRLTVRKDRIEPLRRLAHALQFDGFAKTIDELQSRIDKECGREAVILHKEYSVQGIFEPKATKNPETSAKQSRKQKQCSTISSTGQQPGPIRIKVETDPEDSTLCSKSRDEPCSFHHDCGSGEEEVDAIDTFQCPLCAVSSTATFDGKRELKSHMAVVHPDSRLFECDQCIFDTLHEIELERHVLAHGIKVEPIDSKDAIQAAIDMLNSGQLQNAEYEFESTLDGDATRQAYFRCRQCPKTFANLLALTHHMKLKHRVSRSTVQMIKVNNNKLCHRTKTKKLKWKVLFRCGQCNKTCSLASSRRRRRPKANKARRYSKQLKLKEPFQCGRCPSKSYEDSRSLVRHVQLNHQSVSVVCHDIRKEMHERISCSSCSQLFTRRATLECHVKAMHPEEEDVKPKFNAGTTVMMLLNDNERRRLFYNSINARFIECPRCDGIFSTSGNFNRHMRIVHGETTFAAPFKCPHCTECFAFEMWLRRHVRLKHGGDYDDFTSRRKTQPAISEQQDMKMENDIKPLDKTPISKRVKRETAEESRPDAKLAGVSKGSRTYSLLHGYCPTDESSCNRCMLCQCLFDKDDDLRQHMSVFHPEIEVFECKHCRFWTIQQLRLKKHRCRHHNRWFSSPYLKKGNLCRLCGQTFTLLCNLRRHVANIHERWKPYRCRLCFCSYTRKFELRRHEAAKHQRKLKSRCQSASTADNATT